MAATSQDVVNEALNLIGYDGFPVTGNAPNFDSSTPGKIAAKTYAPAVAAVGRINTWSFARTTAALALTGNVAPFPWSLEYAFPANCIDVWQLASPPAAAPRFVQQAGTAFVQGVTTSIGMAAPNTFGITSGWTVTDNSSSNQPVGTVQSYASSVPAEIGAFAASALVNGVTVSITMETPNTLGIGPGWTITDATAGNVAVGTVLTYVGTALILTAPSLTDSVSSSDQLVFHPPLAALVLAQPALITSVSSIDVLTFTSPASQNLFDINNPIPVSWARGVSIVTSVQSSVIWTNLANALAIFNGNPLESTWDPLFRAAVVSYLASEFGVAGLGKPDLAELYMDRWKQIIPPAAARTDQ